MVAVIARQGIGRLTPVPLDEDFLDQGDRQVSNTVPPVQLGILRQEDQLPLAPGSEFGETPANSVGQAPDIIEDDDFIDPPVLQIFTLFTRFVVTPNGSSGVEVNACSRKKL